MNGKRDNPPIDGCRRPRAIGVVVMGAVLALVIADASAVRGGGARGLGGGRMAQSSVAGASRSMARPSTGGAGLANAGNVNRGNVNTGNVNRGNVNTGNVNRGNVNIGNDVNIDIDGGYGHHDGHYYGHPIAAGVTIGAVAVTTAAVLGSYYRTLPPGCTVVVKGGISYHYCGTVYYQQTWSGNDVVYVVVNP
jgi:hypothetical protein